MKTAELQNVISNIKTAVPVSMDLICDPSNMRVTNNPYKNAKKHVTINGMIGMSYSNGVNNQLSREDKEMNFVSQKPVWMSHLGNNLGINEKNGNVYLPIKVQSSTSPVYICDNVDVTNEINPFLRTSKSPKTQDALETKVIWRTPALTSISKIRMLGAEFTINP